MQTWSKQIISTTFISKPFSSGCSWSPSFVLNQPFLLNLAKEYSTTTWCLLLGPADATKTQNAFHIATPRPRHHCHRLAAPKKAPFLLSGGLALASFLLYIVGFCARVGTDILTAEADRMYWRILYPAKVPLSGTFDPKCRALTGSWRINLRFERSSTCAGRFACQEQVRRSKEKLPCMNCETCRPRNSVKYLSNFTCKRSWTGLMILAACAEFQSNITLVHGLLWGLWGQ